MTFEEANKLLCSGSTEESNLGYKAFGIEEYQSKCDDCVNYGRCAMLKILVCSKCNFYVKGDEIHVI